MSTYDWNEVLALQELCAKKLSCEVASERDGKTRRGSVQMKNRRDGRGPVIFLIFNRCADGRYGKGFWIRFNTR